MTDWVGRKGIVHAWKKDPGNPGSMPMSHTLKSALLPKLPVHYARRSRERKSRLPQHRVRATRGFQFRDHARAESPPVSLGLGFNDDGVTNGAERLVLDGGLPPDLVGIALGGDHGLHSLLPGAGVATPESLPARQALAIWRLSAGWRNAWFLARTIGPASSWPEVARLVRLPVTLSKQENLSPRSPRRRRRYRCFICLRLPA